LSRTGTGEAEQECGLQEQTPQLCRADRSRSDLRSVSLVGSCRTQARLHLQRRMNMEEVQDKPRRRPLVRAASEESSSDLSSISCSPFPGDTLPWNLPKHHRMKRSKSASGDVLDPAERAVIRIAGETFMAFGQSFSVLLLLW
ncbi:hypothetical protein GOODEAATRI_021684, partial [Goodea atripinnis]